MRFWPFDRSDPEPLTPAQLRDKLVEAAASGSRRKLRSLCQRYKRQVAEEIDFLRRVPEGIAADDRSIDRYVKCLGAVAECLAQECGAPELLDRLLGNAEDNPLQRLDRWFGEIEQRMERLEYETLIDEARAFIDKARTLQGGAARHFEVVLYGRLGELLFHSGRVSESLEVCQLAFDLCRANNDIEGQLAYLSSLFETHCYLDDGLAARTAQQLLELQKENGVPTERLRRRIDRMLNGEPLCRVVCVLDGNEIELDEITEFAGGHYRFQFRRNRLSLQKATTLTEQGNQLASAGRHSDALDKYRAASEVDPYNPDPVYQRGMCLLELGLYAKAREAFEDVERLAPGWYRCRTDRWLADGLENGSISDGEFRVLRLLEDGDLDAEQAATMASEAIEQFPRFAPLRLLFGDLCRTRGHLTTAAAEYRRGLELVQEPDLESRLLCALAGTLPTHSPERRELISRALRLDGSLVAHASARLIALQ